jgi:hypothetical protein
MMDYGTHLRTVRIKIEPGDFHNFFVHELVWQAFNGDIPDGWEVRHEKRPMPSMTSTSTPSR